MRVLVHRRHAEPSGASDRRRHVDLVDADVAVGADDGALAQAQVLRLMDDLAGTDLVPAGRQLHAVGPGPALDTGDGHEPRLVGLVLGRDDEVRHPAHPRVDDDVGELAGVAVGAADKGPEDESHRQTAAGEDMPRG